MRSSAVDTWSSTVVSVVCVVPVWGQWCDMSQGGGGRCGGLQVPRCLGRGAAAGGLRRLGALEGAA